MRTFVLITDIPDFVLQPVQAQQQQGDAANHNARAARDPRYERLRRLLADHSSGVMLVMHLETRGYGLALYASEEEALDACKANMVPEQPGKQYPPLRLRIIEREKPLPPEAVYTPHITVEGEEVLKRELAETRGLELVYRGRAVARWCPRTLEGEDCPFGVSCHKIHRVACQQTVRKRPRCRDTNHDGDDDEMMLTAEEDATVARIASCLKAAEEVPCLIPEELRLLPRAFVAVTAEEVDALLSPSSSSSSLLSTLSARVEEAWRQCGSSSSVINADHPVFIRLSIPGGSPWDWSLSSAEGQDSNSGLQALRARCPLPANGAPTPLERDIFCQRLFYHMNQLNAFSSASSALKAFSSSEKVMRAYKRYLKQQGSGASPSPQLFLVVRPWVYLPTVGCEATVFLEKGGKAIRGCVQRYGQLRLMTSAAYIHNSTTTLLGSGNGGVDKQQHQQRASTIDQRLSTYAVMGSEANAEAEEALEGEVRLVSKLFVSAIHNIQRALSRDEARRHLPLNASWCVRLAVRHSTTSSNQAAPTVCVMSLKPYQQALEECPMFMQLEHGGVGEHGQTEVCWNTQKHQYVALFSRDVLERLRAV